MANDNIVLLRHLKQSALRCTAMVTSKISELTTAFSEALAELDDAKQDKLTFDTTPTEGSTNPVTSDGIVKYTAQAVEIDYDMLAFDTSEIVIGTTNTTSVLGQAILGQIILS